MKIRSTAIVILATFFIISCSSDNNEKGTTDNLISSKKTEFQLEVPDNPVSGGTITLSTGFPDVINPVFSDSISGAYISRFVHGYLFTLDSDLKIVTGLCDEVPSVENGLISEDGLEYTFRLKEDLKWHDGNDLTAEDVKFTHDVVKTMHLQKHVVYLDEYKNIDSTEVLNDLEIKFTLLKPSASFINIFITHPVLPKHILHKAQSRDLPIYNRKPIGAGPFKIASWNRGEPLVLKAFNNYYSGKPYLDKIIFKFINSESTSFESIQNWSTDGYLDADSVHLSAGNINSEIKVFQTPSFEWEIMGMNNDNPILKKSEIREAIVNAIDRKSILEKCYSNQGELAYSDIPSFSPFYNSTVKEKAVFDPQSSRELLDSAGWTDSDGDGIRDNNSQRMELNLLVDKDNTERMEAAEMIVSYLGEIGIKINIDGMSSGKILDKFNNGGLLENGDYHLALYGWSLSFNPDNGDMWLSDKTPPKGLNYSRYKNAEMGTLFGNLGRTADKKEIKDIFSRTQEVISEDLPVMPILFKSRTDLFRKTIIGIKPHPVKWMTPWNCNEWWLVPEKQGI